MDRFMEADLDKKTLNTRNDIVQYNKMNDLLLNEMITGHVRAPRKSESVYSRSARSTKSRPIDKKDYLKSIQNEINVVQLQIYFIFYLFF